MSPFKAVANLVTAKRRAAQQPAEFITVIRQAAALLSAGRPSASSGRKSPMPMPLRTSPTPIHETPNAVCTTSVTQHRRAPGRTLSHITAPSEPAGWQQLSATLTGPRHGMSLATIIIVSPMLSRPVKTHIRLARCSKGREHRRILAWPVAGLDQPHARASLEELLTTPDGYYWCLDGSPDRQTLERSDDSNGSRTMKNLTTDPALVLDVMSQLLPQAALPRHWPPRRHCQDAIS